MSNIQQVSGEVVERRLFCDCGEEMKSVGFDRTNWSLRDLGNTPYVCAACGEKETRSGHVFPHRVFVARDGRETVL